MQDLIQKVNSGQQQEGQNAAEMPRYRCHKEVWALKIKAVQLHHPKQEPGADCAGCDTATLTPENEVYAPFEVTADYVNKHKPVAGGYYVVYKDGYLSFSPAGAFEEGYAKIDARTGR